MANESDIQLEAKVIVGFLVFTPFSECTPLSRELEEIPVRPGIGSSGESMPNLNI